MDHFYNMLNEASHTTVGATIFSLRRTEVLEYVIIILMSNSVSHLCATSSASNTSEREILGNRKIFTVSLAPYRSSVKKDRFIITPNTKWYMWWYLYMNWRAAIRHTILTATNDFYLGRGKIMQHILVSAVIMLTLHSRHRESCWRSHILASMTPLFETASSSASLGATCIMYFGAYGSVGEFSGTIYLHRNCRSPVIWSSISSNTRIFTPGATVFRNLCIQDIIVWTVPVRLSVSALAFIRA